MNRNNIIIILLIFVLLILPATKLFSKSGELLFDEDKFALSGCDTSLLKVMLAGKVKPKHVMFDGENAREYETQDATVLVANSIHIPKDTKDAVLLYSRVSNPSKFDFTKLFNGMSRVSLVSMLKALKLSFSTDKENVLLRATIDVQFHFLGEKVDRIDFQCSNGD